MRIILFGALRNDAHATQKGTEPLFQLQPTCVREITQVVDPES
jgi:hypothetical protein